MAIAKEHPRIQVEVVCEGEPLREYDNDDEETAPDQVTKYIEAKSGAEFAVRLELKRPYPDHPLYIRLYLDGEVVGNRIIGDLQYGKGSNGLTRTFDSITSKIAEGQCMVQKYCFCELQIDDTDDQTVDDGLMMSLKSMGEISLKAYYIKNRRQVPCSDRGIDKKRKETGVIPEKALKGKALSHQTSFGAPVNVPYTSSTHHTMFDYVDPRKLPFTTIAFKYRSMAALRSLLVVPRSPSPVPLEARDVSTLTAEESQELIRRMRERQAVSRNVKQETGVKRERSDMGEAGADGDGVSFVSAAKRQRHHITVNENGVETIDLT